MLNGTLVFMMIILLLASLLLRQGALFVASLALLLSAGASWLWGRYCLSGVEYSRRLSERRVFFGETVELSVQISNRKPLPLAWLATEDEFPANLGLLKGRLLPCHLPRRAYLAGLLALRWYERVTRHYQVQATARGRHTFGPVRLRSGDLFGFSLREETLPQLDYLLVYPRVVPLTALGLPAQQILGSLRTRRPIFEDPARTIGVREYAYGDDPRRVHWKATARAQHLLVKVYQPTTTLELIVFLNVNTFEHVWQGILPDRLELLITVAASLASWAVEEGYQVGLLANAALQHSHDLIRRLPSRDPDQLVRILEALALIVPYLTTPMEDLLRAERTGLPWGATLVLVTALLTEEMLATLTTLKAAGHPIALVLVGDQIGPASPPGLTTFRVRGEELWRELQQIRLA